MEKENMRLFLIGGMATGIGITLLAISILPETITPITTAFYAFLGCVICCLVVIFAAVVNSLTTWAGYVHPDDRLWSNILAYLLSLFTVLTYGRFSYAFYGNIWYLNILFNAGTMLVLALVLLFSVVGLGGKFQLRDVIEGVDSEERTKEISARLILFSLLVGGIMAGVQLGIVYLYYFFNDILAFGLPNSYYYIAITIGGIAFILVITLGVVLRSKYEPVGTPRK
jgi:hypothetical protein